MREGGARRWMIRLFVPLVATGASLLCILLWFSPAQAAVLSVMHLVASNYFPDPFGDTRAVLAVIECHRMGIDVYVRVPCDVPLERPHVYSSVWLLAAQTAITQDSTLVVGTAIMLGFCFSLYLLPPARTMLAAVLLTAAVFSNAVIFALWQANADVIVFVMLAITAASLLAPLPFRLAGYGLVLFAGALKFYPVAAMAAAMRERAAMFLILVFGSLAALAIFVWFYGRDALRAMKVVPHGWVTQMSGATILPTGLPLFPWGLRNVVEAPPMGPGGWLLWLSLTLACFSGAAVLSRSGLVSASVQGCTARERTFALIGCIIVLACFFAGQSLRYRDIFLLFILPMWANLAVEAGPRQVRMLFGAGALATIALLWFVHVTNGVDHLLTALGVPDKTGAVLIAMMWLARELIRWGLVTLVLVSAIPLCTTLPVPRAVRGMVQRIVPVQRRSTP